MFILKIHCLELNHLTLSFLVASQFKMLASFQWGLFAIFAFGTFHTQHNFLGCLCLELRMGGISLMKNQHPVVFD
jgi:hypothetical protein